MWSHPERYWGVETLEKWLIDVCDADLAAGSAFLAALSAVDVSDLAASGFADSTFLDASLVFLGALASLMFRQLPQWNLDDIP